MVLFAHSHGKLVHDAAIDPDKVIFCSPADLNQFYPFIAEIINIVKSYGGYQFDRSRGGESAFVRDVAAVEHLKTLCLKSFFRQFAENAERIINPLITLFFIQFVQTDTGPVVKIGGGHANHRIIGFADCEIGPEAQCARENISAVIIGMLADQVDAAGGKEKLYFFVGGAESGDQFVS